MELHRSTREQYPLPEKKMGRNKSSAVDKLLEIEEKKLKMYQQNKSPAPNQDADFHFLLSLQPFLNKVPEQRKMIVRTKLQQVFCEEEICAETERQISSAYTISIENTSNNSSEQNWSYVSSTPEPEHEEVMSLLANHAPNATTNN